MTLRLTGAAALAAVIGTLAFASTAVAAKPSSSSMLVSQPITFTVPAGTFDGVLSISNFTAQNGVVSAVGTLTGTFTDAVTGAVTNIVQNVVLPLLDASGSCQILSLTLGPLHLDVLGLQVDLNQVVLTITAQSGPGNLLGNLLCGIAGALDSNGSATAIANLLNNLLGLI